MTGKLGVTHFWDCLKTLGLILAKNKTGLDRDTYNELLLILQKYHIKQEKEGSEDEEYYKGETGYISVKVLKDTLWAILNLELDKDP